MIAVIFEVEPHASQKDRYLDAAAILKLPVENVDGFVSVERFQSLTNSGKILSPSFFRDEDAVLAWRCTSNHRSAQTCGRREVLANDRLCMASVLRDYGIFDRDQAPNDSKKAHSE